METLQIPKTVREAEEIVQRFESAAPPEWRKVAGTVARNGLQSGRTILDESWIGSEASEKDSYVSEELYIHTKLLLIDDRKVILGSANLNERSQLGDRDSEIVVVVEDQNMIDSSVSPCTRSSGL